MVFSGRNIHIVNPDCVGGRGFYVVDASQSQAAQHPPLWLGFTGNHFQSFEVAEEEDDNNTGGINERKCETILETVPAVGNVSEMTISIDSAGIESTLSCSMDLDDAAEADQQEKIVENMTREKELDMAQAEKNSGQTQP